MNFTRRYNPRTDAATRWPTWRINLVRDLAAGSDIEIDPSIHVIRVSRTPNRADTWWLAVAVAHLDLGHDQEPDGTLTDQQYLDANDLANLRLDIIQPSYF